MPLLAERDARARLAHASEPVTGRSSGGCDTGLDDSISPPVLAWPFCLRQCYVTGLTPTANTSGQYHHNHD